jgi:hypothetical protein
MTTEAPYYETAAGRWLLRITPPLARRIRDKLGVDLFAIALPPPQNPFVRMADSPYLLCDVLWEICGPLAGERSLARDAWEEDLWPAIDAATEALLAGVIASFPEKKRAGLTKLVAAQTAAIDRVIERMSPKMDAIIDAAVDEAIASGLPSTRIPSPSG